MNTIKTVYVVTGSEDGVLGVYSTAKMALDSAKNYATSYGRKLSETHSAMYKALINTGWTMAEGKDEEGLDTVSAEILRMDLNAVFEKMS